MEVLIRIRLCMHDAMRGSCSACRYNISGTWTLPQLAAAKCLHTAKAYLAPSRAVSESSVGSPEAWSGRLPVPYTAGISCSPAVSLGVCIIPGSPAHTPTPIRVPMDQMSFKTQ